MLNIKLQGSTLFLTLHAGILCVQLFLSPCYPHVTSEWGVTISHRSVNEVLAVSICTTLQMTCGLCGREYCAFIELVIDQCVYNRTGV